MAKKQTEEEKLLEDSAKLIMHIIHVVSVRLADRYERKLITELVGLMQTQLSISEDVSKSTDDYIIKKLNEISKWTNN